MLSLIWGIGKRSIQGWCSIFLWIGVGRRLAGHKGVACSHVEFHGEMASSCSQAIVKPSDEVLLIRARNTLNWMIVRSWSTLGEPSRWSWRAATSYCFINSRIPAGPKSLKQRFRRAGLSGKSARLVTTSSPWLRDQEVSEKSADLGLCPLSPLKDVGLDFDTLLRRSARRLFPGESPDFSVRPQ